MDGAVTAVCQRVRKLSAGELNRVAITDHRPGLCRAPDITRDEALGESSILECICEL